MLPTFRRACVGTMLLPGVLACCVAALAAPGPLRTSLGNGQVAANYGRLPLRFEANRGQARGNAKTDPGVQFSARGAGYAVYLTNEEAVLALRRAGNDAGVDVIRMQLKGAHAALSAQGTDELPGRSNYLIGSDTSQWQTEVPAYARVRYADVYDGVDLVYYGNQQQLEYDFVVAPHADAKPIRLHFDGAESVKVDAKGDLQITARGGEIAFHKPLVYQDEKGRRHAIAGGFEVLAGKSVRFTLGSYNHDLPLVIDPTLVYSTYLGGSDSDIMNAIAVDSSGNAYVTGTTASTNYPVTIGAFQTTFSTAFVTKLNATGTALLYSTFLGGSGSSSGGDTGLSIAVDSSGDAYITGSTYSTNFPTTTGAFQTTNKAAAVGSPTSFVSKLNPAGTKLLYSTYLGGTMSDTAYSIAVDSSGDAYVAGGAYSSNFPVTAGIVQSTNKSAPDYGWNLFITKLNPAGSALLYSTYLGGSGDYGSPNNVVLAVDSSGDALVATTVLSTDFPVTAGVFQPQNNATGRGNMTISKLNPTATKLTFSTYLGGSSSPYGDDTPYGLAVAASGNVFLSGTTWETNFPVTKGAFQTTSQNGGDGLSAGFVTKVNATGTALIYSTYLSGSGSDRVRALAFDASGDVYVTGSAGSTDFPVTANAYQTTNPAAFNNGSVVFLTELNPAGAGLVYSTYFGGSNSFSDTGNGIALGAGGTVYLTGYTGASNFPITPSAFESTFNSQNFTTGFVSEFTFGTVVSTKPTGTTVTSNASPAVTGSNVTFTASAAPSTGTGVPTGNVVFSIDLATVATVPLSSTGFATYTTTTPLALGTHNVLASYQGSTTYGASGGNFTESIIPANPVISPASGVHPGAFLVTLTDSTAGTAIYYTIDGSTPSASSTKYAAPFLVSTNAQVKAIAIVSGEPASNVVGATYTVISSPYILAIPASATSTTSATVNALVNANGLAGSYWFLYGTSATALTSATPKLALPAGVLGSRAGIAPIQVSSSLTGLVATTTYYYEVVAATSAGTSSGEVLSFTTK